jgi:hypothetical protein
VCHVRAEIGTPPALLILDDPSVRVSDIDQQLASLGLFALCTVYDFLIRTRQGNRCRH